MNERNTDQVWSILTAEDSADSREIHDKLRAHVELQVGPSERLPVVIISKSKDGKFLGGLRGHSHWKWLYISHLFVEDSARSTGLGRELIRRVEVEAGSRGCLGLYVDTFEESTRDFYLKNGFETVGTIANFPAGKSRFYLSKTLKK